MKAAPAFLFVPFVIAIAFGLTDSGMAQVTITADHPRLLFRPDGTPGCRTFADVRDLYQNNSRYHTYASCVLSLGSSVENDAAKYVLTGNVTFARNSINAMISGSLYYGGSESSSSGTAVAWALAYDWTYQHASDFERSYIESQLRNWALSALSDLNSSGPSEWHGRAQLACQAWIVSLALPHDNPQDISLRNALWNHWQDALRAIDLSEGWPEGPTYWCNNRAIYFPMAYEAYLTAVESHPPMQVDDPLRPILKLGLWQMYTDRGDGSMNRYGDVSSAVVYRDNGTFPSLFDYYARITRDPLLATYCEYARTVRTSVSSYYWTGYRWRYVFTYDPAVPKPDGFSYSDPAATLHDYAPKAEIFGQDAFGFVVIRTGWGEGETQISYKAGDYLAHHGHYDQGTFTIFKYAPLVINSGGYGSYFDDHRLNYYVRTVSKNSILVMRPDEQWTPSGVAPPGGYVNDGGQRIVCATGSWITSVDNWLANRYSGPHYELADIKVFEHDDAQYTYIDSDLTRAYNSTLWDSEGQGGKVSLVTRQLMWLPDREALIIFDRVQSTDPNYKKKWLLHTPDKPAGGTEVVAVGTDTDGIIEVDGSSINDDILISTNGQGRLFHQILLPASYMVNKVGGPDYRWYVEDDGDDDDGYDGSNHTGGYTPRYWHDYGDWRIEVYPKARQAFDVFLNVLWPRGADTLSVEPAELLTGAEALIAVRLGDCVVAFGATGRITDAVYYELDTQVPSTHRIVDLQPDTDYYILCGYYDLWLVHTSSGGVLQFTDYQTGPHRVTISSETLYLPSDINEDGSVDLLDLLVLVNAFGSSQPDPNYDPAADINGDGSVDLLDLLILAATFGNEGPQPQ